MGKTQKIWTPVVLGLGATVLLSACDKPLDFDLRHLGGGFNTSNAAHQASAPRPKADKRGIISYPTYQVAIAQPGDTIEDVAQRVGISTQELARYNGIPVDAKLRQDEVIALPRRVPGTQNATQEGIDITTLAGNAIDRSDGQTPPKQGASTNAKEPIRHQVEPGETAFSISRLYNVSVRSLAEWNGLGPDLSVRTDQFLLIPVAVSPPPAVTEQSAPGEGSATPEPPSAAKPLPKLEPQKPAAKPASPELSTQRSSTSDNAALAMPVGGKIIRPYTKGKNDGIDIAAEAGKPVVAAADGVVAAITRNTEGVPIVVLKHANNLLTVYAGVDGLTIKKGARVKRGQKIAVIRQGSPSFLHFEVRKGLDSVDPMTFLN